MPNARCLSLSAALAGSIAASVPASAAEYTFDVLVETGDTFAGLEISELRDAPIINLNDAGVITFGHQGPEDQGTAYFRGSLAGGAESVLYAVGGTFDGAPVREAGLYVGLNQASDTAFVFSKSDGGIDEVIAGNFAGSDQVLYQAGDSLSNGETYSPPDSESVDINDGGTVAHFASIPEPANPPQGFNYNALERLVIGGTVVKRGGDADGNPLDTLAGSQFYGFNQQSRVDLNDGGDYLVSFWKDAAFDSALAYVQADGTEVLLADRGEAFVTGETIGDVGRGFALNNDRDVAYSLYLDPQNPGDDGRGLILLNDAIAFQDGDVVDGFTLDGLANGFIRLTEDGTLAFSFEYTIDLANDLYGDGIIVGGQVVAHTGMVIDGKTVEGVFTDGFGLNELGQLVFGVEYTDGSTAMIFANVPEPASLALLALGGGLLVSRRRR